MATNFQNTPFRQTEKGEPASHSGRGGSLKQRTPKRTPPRVPPHTGRFDSIFSKISESSTPPIPVLYIWNELTNLQYNNSFYQLQLAIKLQILTSLVSGLSCIEAHVALM